MKTATQVNISAFHDLPVQVRNTSSKLVKIIYNKAKSNPDDISPILVGRVNEIIYPINDFEIVLGFRKANIEKINAFIIDYTTMQDLIIAHVRENFHPQTVDPLKAQQVIRYMTKDGIEESEICKILWLDKRPVLFDTIRCKITDDAMTILLEMIEEISKKVYSIVTPIYYVTKLSQIKEDEQARAANEIKSITVSKMLSDTKSSWPSKDSLRDLLSSYHRKKNIPSTEERMAEYGEVDDLTKSTKKSKTSTKKSPDPKTVKKAEPYIGTDPNLIYVPIKGAHPDLVLHKKTGRVAIAKEKSGTYSITDDIGKSTHVLADHVVEFLDLDNIDAMFVYKYTTFEKAQKALADAKESQKCVILSPVRLPRR